MLILDTHVAGNTPENVGIDDIGTGSRWRCTSRKDKPQYHSSMDGQRVVQIDHRLGESHIRYDGWQSRRMVELGKGNPGGAASELGALDWERPAMRGHDGSIAPTWTFPQCVETDYQILARWLHPTSMKKRSRLW